MNNVFDVNGAFYMFTARIVNSVIKFKDFAQNYLKYFLLNLVKCEI